MTTLVPELGDPVDFYQRRFGNQWWTSTIQPFAQMKRSLTGEGLHRHHLIPKSLFEHGPPKTQDLGDYVPSVPLTEAEHLKTLHCSLNRFLTGFWKRSLSSGELRRAIEMTAEFYEHHGLRHFAAAVRGFRREAYDKVA